MVPMQQFIEGAKRYIASDVIPHMPTDRQFITGVALGVASSKMDRIATYLKENPLVQVLGLVDGDMVDDDALITAMREQMQKQGAVHMDVPWIGKLSFAAQDVDALHRAIHGR